MAVATYTPTTSGTDLKELWRKIQVGVYIAANFGVEEWNALQQAKPLDVDVSTREITIELDIKQAYGATFIPEGGKEARPSTPTTVTGTLTFTLMNKRFTASRHAEILSSEQGMRGQLESQLKYQGRKAKEAIRARIGDAFWGFSTGTTCLVSSVSTDDIVLKDMHGITGLGSTSHNRRCADQFQVGDYIAVLNPSGPALRAGGIVAITAVTRSTNTITAGASGITSPTANDLIVYANSLENTTLAGGTERNLALVGVLDQMTSTSVHGVSGSTHAKWNANAFTGGGRFTGITLRKMKQAINNEGGGDMDTVWWANGVENDVTAQYMAGVRYTSPFNMEIDGQPSSKGVKFNTSRRVPDGYAFGWDKSKSVQKMTISPDPSAPGWGDGDKLQDDSGKVFSLDYMTAMLTVSRANMAYASGLTQQ